MMSKSKTANFTPDGIDQLPNDQPVVYKIKNRAGTNIYTGVAQRGQVHDRLKDHLRGAKDAIPGATKAHIQQKDNIRAARKSESAIISRSKPKYNKRGK